MDRVNLLYGTSDVRPERLPLKAGPLSILYEQGELRYVRLGATEIVRRIYVAVRDQNWRTLPAQLSAIATETASDSFRISFDALHQEGGASFFWKGSLAGTPDGEIVFSMEGLVRSTFLRNRIGICVLHPIRECAGQPCVIDRDGGVNLAGEFPEWITADQPFGPFTDIRGMVYNAAGTVETELRFGGELFESEDQRNWTDTSFKTFSTPLRLPKPVLVEQGAEIRQSVTILVRNRDRAATAGKSSVVAIGPTAGPSHPLPAIGLAMAGDGAPLTDEAIRSLRMLGPRRLSVPLRLSVPCWESALDLAVRTSASLSVPCNLDVSVDRESDFDALIERLRVLELRIESITLFHERENTTRSELISAARQRIAGSLSTVLLGGGSKADFFELNRARPRVDGFDFVCYSINPQVHASDDLSLFENLEAQGSTVASARQYFPGRPIAVGPITLKPRFNAAASTPEAKAAPAPEDPRQRSLLAAAWTLGSLKHLSENGASSLTYYETAGGRGVMDSDGCVFPLYHVLASVLEFSGGSVVRMRSGMPLAAGALRIVKEGVRRTLIANYQDRPEAIQLDGLAPEIRIRILDETTARMAISDPMTFREPAQVISPDPGGSMRLDLRPYAIVCLDEMIGSHAGPR